MLSWALLGSPGFSWALLSSPGLTSGFLGSLGFSWAPLSWAVLGCPGLPWAPLGSPGLSWLPLASLWVSRAPLLAVIRIVFAVVRRSRMKCPHDIGRDSWVWGEQETLLMMNSPDECGGRTLRREERLVGRKRGGPWVK